MRWKLFGIIRVGWKSRTTQTCVTVRQTRCFFCVCCSGSKGPFGMIGYVSIWGEDGKGCRDVSYVFARKIISRDDFMYQTKHLNTKIDLKSPTASIYSKYTRKPTVTIPSTLTIPSTRAEKNLRWCQALVSGEKPKVKRFEMLKNHQTT